MNARWVIGVHNPAVRDHVLYGEHVLPGLAYVDLLYQFFGKHGRDWRTLELRNLSILRPLVVSRERPVVLDLQAIAQSGDRWRVEIHGRDRSDGTLCAAARRYATAEMVDVGPASFEGRLDASHASMDRTDLDDIYARRRAQGLVHAAFMKVHGMVRADESAVYVECGLSEDGTNESARLIFHPALVDGGAVGAAAALARPWSGPGGFEPAASEQTDEDDRLEVPLHIGSFRAAAPLQTGVWVRARRDRVRRRQDLKWFTLEFFDGNGRQVAQLTDLVSKRVRNGRLLASDDGSAKRTVDKERGGIHSRRPDDAPGARAVSSPSPASRAQDVESFLAQLIAERLGGAAEGVDRSAGFFDLGLDSVALLELVGRIEAHVSLPVSPTLLFEYPTLADLVAYLAPHWRAAAGPEPGESSHLPAATTAHPGAFEGMRPAVDKTPGGIHSRRAKDPSRGDRAAIAIVGMAGRFPGARNLDEFWRNLEAGKDCVTEVPASRWDWRRFDGVRTPSGRPVSRWGGFIDDPDRFDPQFFRIAPRQAEVMDPQERLFLQTCWEALEDAGHTPESVAAARAVDGRRPVGVFVGVMHKDYALLGQEAMARGHALPLSLSNAAIANRVSYVCDFHGPSLVVDTVCSSSLVALHLAVQSLRSGECAAALAGGVNLSLHPAKYLTYGLMGMHASDGRCRSFGQGGDGYVSAEGVGAVLLKPLAAALADGDHVYAIIRASTSNHVGAVSGFTVPSPTAQADLIGACLRDADIPPRTIGSVEAHGTGTALGDPIEIEGLCKAFAAATGDTGFCAIGSVKSNIGHAESAAGIAGVIKAVLQLHHRRLVPSLHARTLNPHVDWARTPFVVPQEAGAWEAPAVPADAAEAPPRRAAVSSFGATGSNVHVILEEHPSPETVLDTASAGAPPAVVVPLSARTEEQLHQCVERLHDHLVREDGLSLASVACTLQTGRLLHDVRVAFVSESLGGLIEQLAAYRRGTRDIVGGYRGDARQASTLLKTLDADDDLQGLVEKWQEEHRLEKLARVWALGADVDWAALWRDERPRRVSLPTYPFLKQRYWLPEGEWRSAAVAVVQHPLLHENTSDLGEQRFQSRFTGEEPFLRDHVVRGRRTLPGVAYLEMVRAAVEASWDGERGTGITLRDVVWLRPAVAAGEVLSLCVGLCEEEGGEVSCTVYSESADGEGVRHGEGRARVGATGPAERLDVAGLKASCSRSFTAEECYEALGRQGLEYGAWHRGLRAVSVGEDASGGFVVAEVALPACARDERERYVLHPSILDSALQASIGLSLADASGAPLMVPFALERLTVWQGSPERGFVYLRRREGAGGAVRVVDVDICDEDGQVCVRLSGLSSRVLEEASIEPRGVLVWVPEWGTGSEVNSGVRSFAQRHVFVERRWESVGEALRARGVAVERLPSSEDDIGERVAACGVQMFERLQEVLRARPSGEVLVQVAVSRTAEGGRCLSALSGLLKSVHQENPRVMGQVLEMEPGASASEVRERLEAEMHSGEWEVSYAGGVREVCRWREVGEASAVEAPWKDGGLYLITGGAGGLGLIFAEEIVRRARGARVVLAGRSEPGEELRARLSGLGRGVEYRRVDVADGAAVDEMVEQVQARHGVLSGVIHAAGVIGDGFVIRKTVEEFRRVLPAKVDGTLHLDRATADVPLECFVLFSSVVGVLGNAGQAEYALANAFLDRYAEHRAGLVEQGRRHGRTLSISWPLWEQGGMALADEYRAALRARGRDPLSTEAGLAAFHQAYASGAPRVVVLAGERARLRRALSESTSAPVMPSAASSVVPSSSRSETEGGLAERSVEYLKTLLSATLKLPPEQIDAEAALEQYGIDSILAVQMVNALEVTFGPLSKTLLFEYESIAALSGYFLASHRGQVEGLLGAAGMRAEPAISAEPAVPAVGRRRSRRRRAETGAGDGPLDIAIIGVSGRYPQAKDLQEYWENLASGRDCITEVPPSRWDHSLYYDESKDRPGRTYSKWGGFIEGVDEFDPLFFNISPREAMGMDPQARLFLQCVYATLEDAGYTPEALRELGEAGAGRVGVFVGAMYEEYQLYGAQAQALGRPYAVSGSAASIANRVSYYFNFQGPSLTVDTMCSSSLTSIHLACRSLRDGECEVAVAGGVNVSIHPNKYLLLAQGRFASSTGRCESFGEGGDGYVPGEGVGAVLLKPLARAEAEGDHIYGVIKGSAINHGGKTNGYSVPNPNAQAQVIARALAQSGIEARALSYVEAHGTGTSLGDPIEITGLSKAFGEPRSQMQFCAIGSAKSNIGHCESAAGIAGLTKVLLQLQHATLVPSLHSSVLNPHIDFARTPFRVQRERAPWRRPVVDGRERPRAAGISSFGAGGANAHLIVQEPLSTGAEPRRGTSGEPGLLVLSARTPDRLRERARELLHALEGRLAEADLADVLYTLQVGREAMDTRMACVVTSLEHMKATLARVVQGDGDIEGLHRGEIEPAHGPRPSVPSGGGPLTLASLAEAWTKGANGRWTALYGGKTPRRVSLPTYPFARERYWIAEPAEVQPQREGSRVGADAEEVRFLTELLADLKRGSISVDTARESTIARLFTGVEA